MNGARLYGRMLALSIRGQMQYRASFILLAIGSFLTTAAEAVGVWALFDRFGMMLEWRLEHIAFLYGLVNVAFSCAEASSRSFDVFGTEFVKTGDFDRILLRPRSALLQIAGNEFQLHRLGRLLQGLAILGWAVVALDIVWVPWKVALLAAALVSGVLFFYALFVLQAALSFWTTESLEVMNTLTYGGAETAQYPLSIYHRYFRRFFTYVIPLGCISYFPAVAIFGIEDPLGTSLGWQISAPFASVVFALVAIVAWQTGVRHYSSTGS